MPDMTWRLMPVEATTKMWSAGNRAHTGDVGGGAYFDTTAIYNAMLTASPDPAEDERLVRLIADNMMDHWREVARYEGRPVEDVFAGYARAVIRLLGKG